MNTGDSVVLPAFTVHSFDGTPTTITVTVNGLDDNLPPMR